MFEKLKNINKNRIIKSNIKNSYRLISKKYDEMSIFMNNLYKKESKCHKKIDFLSSDLMLLCKDLEKFKEEYKEENPYTFREIITPCQKELKEGLRYRKRCKEEITYYFKNKIKKRTKLKILEL